MALEDEIKVSSVLEMRRQFYLLNFVFFSKSNRDVIKILQEQLRIFNTENTFSINHESDQDTPYLQLKFRISQLESENRNLKMENSELRSNKSVLEELLETRDRSLVSLTHEVYELEDKNSKMATLADMERELLLDEMPRKLKSRIEQLEDIANAYEAQNEFLNKEIIELNEIKHVLELKKKDLEAKLCEVEAKCSQIQSKLLSLLKELNQSYQEAAQAAEENLHGESKVSFVNNETIKQLVARLLEESSLDIPLSWKPGNRSRKNWASPDHQTTASPQDFDELGFYHGNQGCISQLYDLNLEPDKNELAWKSKWSEFLANCQANNNSVAIGNVELKQLLRMGVPQEYRCKVWRLLIHQRVKGVKAVLGSDYYERLLR